jgi:hypothetical protein
MQRDRRLTAMRAAFPEAMVKIPKRLLEAFDCGEDKDDRHVVAAAVRGQANAIITYNIKHFPAPCLEEYDLISQTPDDFLVHQFYLNSPLVLEKLDQQAAAIGQRRIDLMFKLEKATPQFVDLVRKNSS